MMAKRIHAERMGFSLGEDKEVRILVTGGGSVNKSILQIVADVFNANVFTMVTTTHTLILNIHSLFQVCSQLCSPGWSLQSKILFHEDR